MVVQYFPQREDIGVLCWSIPKEGAGFISQVSVFQTDNQGSPKLLWQSPLDNSYAPKIRFIPEITVQGLPLALVERQTGAASSQLDVIGKSAGRVKRLLQIGGSQFDITLLDTGKLPFIIAHGDADILDVPAIYRWNGRQFVEDSASHSEFYRRLVAEDKAKLPPDASAVVLVNLSRIAAMAGDRAAAKSILVDAACRERSRGNAANQETLRLIAKQLQILGYGSRTSPN